MEPVSALSGPNDDSGGIQTSPVCSLPQLVGQRAGRLFVPMPSRAVPGRELSYLRLVLARPP